MAVISIEFTFDCVLDLCDRQIEVGEPGKRCSGLRRDSRADCFITVKLGAALPPEAVAALRALSVCMLHDMRSKS